MTRVGLPSVTAPVANGVTQRLPLLVAAALLDGPGPSDRRVCLINMQESSAPHEIAASPRDAESRRVRR